MRFFWEPILKTGSEPTMIHLDRAFIRNLQNSTPHRRLLFFFNKNFFVLSPLSLDCTCPINKIIKLTKKAIELLDEVTSVPYSRKGLGYTIGHGLDAVLPFTCYSDWFSWLTRGKLTKALLEDNRFFVHVCG
jgi:hypothetical protein